MDKGQVFKQVEAIKQMVCYYHGLQPHQVDAKTKKREVVQARQIIHAISRGLFRGNISLAEIGELVGGKDHATVIHSCKTVRNLCETDKKYLLLYTKLYAKAVDATGQAEYKAHSERQRNDPTVATIREVLTALGMVKGAIHLKINLRAKMAHLNAA